MPAAEVGLYISHAASLQLLAATAVAGHAAARLAAHHSQRCWLQSEALSGDAASMLANVRQLLQDDSAHVEFQVGKECMLFED